MSADTATYAGPGTGSLSAARVVRAEWTKFRTLPSNLITLTVMFATIVGLAGVILAAMTGEGLVPAPIELLAGVSWAQFLPAVLGVVAICSEWASGTSRVTFLAVPTRWPVLVGKAVVVGGATFVVGAAGAAGALVLGAGSGVDVGGADPALVTRLVVGTGLYLGTIAVFALGLGAMVRNLVGSILAVLGFLWIVPFAAALIPVPEVQELTPYLPANAGVLLIAPANPAVELTPWGGYAVLLAWTVAALAGAILTLRTHDV